MYLLDLGLDKDLKQGNYKRVIKVFIKDIRVVITYVRATMIVKL